MSYSAGVWAFLGMECVGMRWQTVEKYADRFFPALGCIYMANGIFIQFAPGNGWPMWVSLLSLAATLWWLIYGIRVMFKGVK